MQSSCITQHLLKSGLVNEIPQKLPSPAFTFHKRSGCTFAGGTCEGQNVPENSPFNSLKRYLSCPENYVLPVIQVGHLKSFSSKEGCYFMLKDGYIEKFCGYLYTFVCSRCME